MRKRQTPAPDLSQSQPGWSPSARRIATVLILFHFSAVVIAPWSSPPPSSDLSRSLAGLIRPYLKGMSLDNGYRFFAPNPGPSHLVRYELLRNGELIGEGTFPDRNRHWPRLLYHRQFMISEMISSQLPPPVPPAEMARWNENERRMYERERQHGARLVRSVAGELLRQHPQADAVRLFLVTHLIPSPLDVLAGRSLRDAVLYEEVPLGEFPRGGG